MLVKTIKISFIGILCTLFSNYFLVSCKKFIAVDPPSTSTNAANVFISNETAAAVLTGIYTKMISAGISAGGYTSLELFSALSSDELILYSGSTNLTYLNYYKNNLSASLYGYDAWNKAYPLIFTCNSAIEALPISTNLTPAVKQNLLGEAKFLRAFFYFYLVNFYGDVPLVLSTDYKLNSTLPRTSKAEVYVQLIKDLQDAQNLLSNDYLSSDALSTYPERVRPNKWAATALLARAYLYIGDYQNAEKQSTLIINNTTLFSLSPLDTVFLRASLGNNSGM